MPRTSQKKEASTAAFEAVEDKAVETAVETSTAETTEVNSSDVKADEVMGNPEPSGANAPEIKADEVMGNTTKTTEVNSSDVKEESQAVTENHFYDDETVKIKSAKRAGKAITANTGKSIQFDSEGIAEVSGIEAKYLLTCPGFELVK